MNIKSLFSIAAASLGLGIAVIVDQPAAFARCDHGTCPCRDESWTGDSVNHNKCRADQFCAQKVPEHGDKHVYVCRPEKPAGWGCTEDRQCKSRSCKNKKCTYTAWCRDFNAPGQDSITEGSAQSMRDQCCKKTGSRAKHRNKGDYCYRKGGKTYCPKPLLEKSWFWCAKKSKNDYRRGNPCGVGGTDPQQSKNNCNRVCVKNEFGPLYYYNNGCGNHTTNSDRNDPYTY